MKIAVLETELTVMTTSIVDQLSSIVIVEH